MSRVIYGSNNKPKGATKDAAGNYTAPSTPAPKTSGGSTGATTAGVAPSTATQTAFNTAGIKDTSGLNIAGINAIANKPPAPVEQNTYYPRYTQNEQQASDYLDTFQAPQSVEQIQREKMKSAQQEINGLNDYYGSLLKEQQTVNQGNERATASVNTLTGLAGSSEANVASAATAKQGVQADAKIMAQKQVELGGLLSSIRQSAVQEASQQKTAARQSAVDIMQNKAAKQEEAVGQVTNLAKSGVTIEGLKATDPQSYAHLAQQVGGEGQLKAMMVLNRPQETIEDKKVVNGSYMIAYRNPITGTMRMEVLDLGLPPQYTKTADFGDQIAFLPDNFNPNDPNSPQPIYVPKGLSPDQKENNAIGWANVKTGQYNAETSRMNANTARDKASGDGSGNDQLYSGLSTATASAVRARVSKYTSEPLVQNFATIQDGKNFASSIYDTTTNPADDQALIYSLAKVMDPGSVVREGEYATAQKYSQSWIKAFGTGVEQAMLGTGFLSQEARSNIKKTIEQKANSSKVSYDNINKQYETGINNLTGRNDGQKFIVDYVTPSTQETPAYGPQQPAVIEFTD